MLRVLTSTLIFRSLPAKALLAFLLIIFSLIPPALGSQQTEPKRVLVLFSFRPTLPVASEWDRSIRSVFRANTSHRIEIHIEHLDLTHFEENRHIQLLLDVYRYKYSKQKPDLIIPVFNSAVDLVLKHGPDLFPGVPIVFGGIEDEFIENLSLGPNITGYLRDNDYTATLELALQLHPNTRQVVVFAGADPVGRKWSKTARKAFQEYEDRFDFSYLIGLPMEVLFEKLANLPAQTVIMALPFLKDGSGKDFIFNDVLSQITTVANAPIYTFWDVCIGTGIVGGYLSSFEKEAKAVARLALRVLNGEDPADIPVTRAPMFSYMFDWRQLKRWSIPAHKLPPDSIVKFKELTVWNRYKAQIISAIALALFQALLISYLLYQRRIHRLTEEKLLQTEQKYRTVADYTYDWEYWQNYDGSLQYVSPSCERICGFTSQDFMKNPSLLQDIIVPDDKESWDEHRRSLKKETKSAGIQFRIRRQDGEIRWIEHACQPVYDDQGNPSGLRASNRDITERKNYETETLQLQSELAHIGMVSTIGTLTSALAHEINQPLAAMRSYAQAALRFLDADQPDYHNLRKALQGIVADNKRASSVINHLRSLIKKEKHRVESFDVNSLIERVVFLLNSEIILRNAEVKLNLHPNAPTFYGDSVQIQQVIINLLTNALDAIDNQPLGRRHIALFTKTEKPGDIIVSVSDSGGGIDPDKMGEIFNPFYTMKSHGMGLGLAICQSIIEMHGGQLDCENNPGGGATFSFTLPADKK